IDYHLSSGPALLGHAHPAVTAAVAAQVPKGTTYFFLNEPEIELARRMVEAIPCADVIHYTGSGTEATFYALRIARAFTKRRKVRRRARPRMLRKGRQRRISARCDCRQRRSHVGARCAQAPGRRSRLGDEYAERQPGVRGRRMRSARRVSEARRLRSTASGR